jgi:G6PDH family F420-dependent oxidoreductase
VTDFGFFLSSEEQSPRSLVDHAVAAEAAGFDRLWISDHYHPWNDQQGESSFVWGVLGAIAARTERLTVTTSVTCPIMRIHPAVLAQAAATAQALFDGRFQFGVGTGEALNEHILGDAWPSAEVRLEMLEEAIEVMRALWTGELVRHRGAHFTVDTARIYSLPAQPIPVLVSGFGPKATELAGRLGDGFLTVQPDADAVQLFRKSGGAGKPVQGGLKVCWGEDEAAARALVHRLWPNEALEGEALQVLTSPQHFTQLTDALVDEQTAVGAIGAVGTDVDSYVEAVRPFVAAGFDELYLSQIGPDQEGFLDFWTRELQPALARL